MAGNKECNPAILLAIAARIADLSKGISKYLCIDVISALHRVFENEFLELVSYPVFRSS